VNRVDVVAECVGERGGEPLQGQFVPREFDCLARPPDRVVERRRDQPSDVRDVDDVE